MKIGVITRPNEKGQIVIPKKIRKALGIDTNVSLNVVLRGEGICIFPVKEVITKGERESSYLEILQKTQGSWAEEDWDSLRKKRRKAEMLASQRRKETW